MADDPKAVVRGVIDALNRGDLDAFTQLLAPDAVDRTPLPAQAPGVEGWRRKWKMLYEAFPDVNLAIEECIAEGGTVATRYTMRATHEGEFLGIPPTGKEVEILLLDMIRVRDGKVVEHWGLFDQTALMEQLGVR